MHTKLPVYIPNVYWIVIVYAEIDDPHMSLGKTNHMTFHLHYLKVGKR